VTARRVHLRYASAHNALGLIGRTSSQTVVICVLTQTAIYKFISSICLYELVLTIQKHDFAIVKATDSSIFIAYELSG
jgi:hypothetical protein